MKNLKRKDDRISCCGKYYCAYCDYHRGTMVKAAKNLLSFAERYGSLKLIVGGSKAFDFDEFLKGLKWIASKERPCKGCRFGGGWSWWSNCPVRDCVIKKNLDFCYQCKEFPCSRLKEEPLLERKRQMIEINNRIKAMGIEKWTQLLKQRYQKSRTTQNVDTYP